MIPQQTPVKNHWGNNSTTVFDFDFYINDAEQIKVTHTDMSGYVSNPVLGVDYTVNSVGNLNGGNITFPIEGSAYSVLGWNESTNEKELLSIALDLPVEQPAEYSMSGDLNKKNLEYSLDYITRILQIMNRLLARAVKIQEGSNIDTDTLAINLNKVADISEHVSTVAANTSDISTVATNVLDVNTVATDILDVSTVADNITNVNTAALDIAKINTVAGDINRVGLVADDIGSVHTVAVDISNVIDVADNKTNIDTVAADISNINSVASDLTNIDNASGYAATAIQYAIGEPTEPSEGSAKYWAGQAAAGQIQADWLQADDTKKDYIKNKPDLSTKQDKLVTGTNIKTINNQSILGSGNINTPIRNIGEIVASTIPLTDAGLHLLDGALINGSGIYADFVSKISDIYNNTSTVTSNIYKVGTPIEADGVLCGLSANNYGKLPISFNPGFSTWEIKLKITTGAIDSTWQQIFSTTQGTTTATRYGLRIGISDTNYFNFDLGTSSSDWVQITTTYTPLSNTTYYLKYTFDGSVYKLGISTDDTNYTEFTTNNSSPTLTSAISYMGTWTNYNDDWAYFKGSIDLNECYINIDGSRWWNGVNPTGFIDENSWQSSVSSYGVCGKFVYNSVNNTVRLPKITGIVEGTTDLTALGDLVAAGLPNITGDVGTTTASAPTSGAFYVSNTSGNIATTGGSGYSTKFDASRTSSLYRNSFNKVQPQTIKVLYYIVVATITKTDIQVDIDDIATDLNGKADVDLTNVNNSGTSKGASWGMPSTTKEILTTGTSGTTYTAVATGWVCWAVQRQNSGLYAELNNMTKGINMSGDVSGQFSKFYVPVEKGDTFRIVYNDTLYTSNLYFIYAVGTESEAQ